MRQHYSDQTRETEPQALPDVEIWQDSITIIRSKCGEFEVPAESDWARGFCPSCDRATCVDDLGTFDPNESGIQRTTKKGWFYWFCFPGCLPDSEPVGPFGSEAEALEDARSCND